MKAETKELEELETLAAKQEMCMKEIGKKSQPPTTTGVNNIKTTSEENEEKKCTKCTKTGHTEAICERNICKHCSMKRHKDTRCWYKHGYPPSVAIVKNVKSNDPSGIHPPRRAITHKPSEATEPYSTTAKVVRSHQESSILTKDK